MLDLIKQIWEKSPDLRLGQLIANTCNHTAEELYGYEDDQLARLLKMTYLKDT